MNKNDLVEKMAENAGLTKIQAQLALESALAAIAETLQMGHEVSLVGFGSFSVGDRAERVGKNPRTGEEIFIKASRIPKFKAGKGLKDILNT